MQCRKRRYIREIPINKKFVRKVLFDLNLIYGKLALRNLCNFRYTRKIRSKLKSGDRSIDAEVNKNIDTIILSVNNKNRLKPFIAIKYKPDRTVDGTIGFSLRQTHCCEMRFDHIATPMRSAAALLIKQSFYAFEMLSSFVSLPSEQKSV